MFMVVAPWFRFDRLCLSVLLGLILWWGGSLPAQAADRLFAPWQLEFLDRIVLPTQFEDQALGGLSGITYDAKGDRFYAVSDQREQPRFYTLKLDLDQTGDRPQIAAVTVADRTPLHTATGEDFAPQTIDPEAIALSPRDTFWISSEVGPWLGEFDRQGRELQRLRLPDRFLPDEAGTRGIQDNRGFEGLTINAGSGLASDPFRLFTLTEAPLKQDLSRSVRLLHYLINPPNLGDPVLIAEHRYPLDPADGALFQGVSEILAVPPGEKFLVLERSLGLTGFQGKLYQGVIADATDTSPLAFLSGDLGSAGAIHKKLLLDLKDIGTNLDNLEGMTLGPRLADGSPSLILVSDNNFRSQQSNQFWLFRLRSVSPKSAA